METTSQYVLHRRFDRLGRLIGDASMLKLFKSHVMVIGLGGVGSWAAEMLARSGVGKITIIDFDEVCITNFNRQLHALQGEVGKQKSVIMGERLKKINPSAQIITMTKFYNADSCDEIFAERPDYVIDAIDNVTAKCHLIHYCYHQKIPLIVSTGSAGKLDPVKVEVKDLGKTQMDPLAKAVRRILKQQYGFKDRRHYGIKAVFSTEPVREPKELKYDQGKGFKCVCPQGDNPYFNCDSRNIILGSSGFVTAAFGLACASQVVNDLIADTDQSVESLTNTPLATPVLESSHETRL
jgi:tRNA A37 threonylcarbamoyladenosine dehydratase